MKVKECLHNIQQSPYYQRLVELSQTSREHFYLRRWNSKIYPFHWRDSTDHYTSGNRIQLAISNLAKHTPSYTGTLTFPFGCMTFQAKYYIGLSNDHQPEILKRVHITTDDKVSVSLWGTGWDRLELSPGNNLDDLEARVHNHLRAYFYPGGLIQTIQHKMVLTKAAARSRFIHYLSNKSLHLSEPLDELRVQKLIAKRFNLISDVDLDKTIAVVNRCGKLPKPTRLLPFDLSFFESFDGDIDELEEAFYDSNPIDGDTLYI